MQNIKNIELERAFDFVQFTDRNIFLTGKAGTGKTTFLHNLKKRFFKRMIVVAPTGVAAINAGGVTIHSFFQLSFSPQIPTFYIDDLIGPSPSSTGQVIYKMNKKKIKIIKTLDLLVIDEISMVRSDLLDAIDGVLRRYRNRGKPFGGVQLLMIGDIQQLAPIVKDDEWKIISEYYKSPFFFASLALAQTTYITIELMHIYRQSDLTFINLLNKLRDVRQMDQTVINEINKRYDPDLNYDSLEGYITLTTHNYQAEAINNSKLNKLPGKSKSFTATVEGDFPEYLYPTGFELELKVNSQVMFVKNDPSPDKQYFNGKIGFVARFDKDVIIVRCPEDNSSIVVAKDLWPNVKYTIDEESKAIKESVAGSFTQYPLKLAWAITIHKSQGLTFEKVIVNAKSAFAFGQVYVALSRCRTLEKLVLSSPITQKGIISDESVNKFVCEIEEKSFDKAEFETAKKDYQEMLLIELFDFSLIQRLSYYTRKILKEHKEVLIGNPLEKMEKIIANIQDELVRISLKFNPRLHEYLQDERFDSIELNIPLQERVKKASLYFSDKLLSITKDIKDELIFETDNKSVKKSISQALENLSLECYIKLSCLKDSLKFGFVVKKYLESKARATIDFVPIKKISKSKKRSEEKLLVTSHPKLLKRLKTWRNEKAQEMNVPHFMILHQKVIVQMAEDRPLSKKELLNIKGIGAKKAKSYADELLAIVRDYVKKNK